MEADQEQYGRIMISASWRGRVTARQEQEQGLCYKNAETSQKPDIVHEKNNSFQSLNFFASVV